MDKITAAQAVVFEEIINRIAQAMAGFRWGIDGVVEKPYSDDFVKQKCDNGLFEYELCAQYGNGDYGYHGEVLFPIGQKFVKVTYNDGELSDCFKEK